MFYANPPFLHSILIFGTFARGPTLARSRTLTFYRISEIFENKRIVITRNRPSFNKNIFIIVYFE